MLEHGDALNPHAKSESLHPVGFIVDETEDVGIYHAGPQYFQPAAVLAGAAAVAATDHAGDIHLDAGFREGEEMRPQTDDPVGPEDRPHESLQRALEVSHGDVLVH